MSGIILMATQKIFEVIFFKQFFFNRISNFVGKQTLFEKKFLHAKFNILRA